MKKLIVLTLLFQTIVFAQRPENITLTGRVLEQSTQQPLEYATLVLTHAKSKRVTGGVTDANGRFSIQIPKGLYDMKVEFVGFKTKKLPSRNLIKNTDLKTIFLSEDSETLDEVKIVAEKTTVEIRLDKKIYNVGKDMTIKGGSASDVLDNVPSVNVDAEGAISLRGNENVQILIDGKPSALVGLNGSDALRNLPADAIEKVEVITSPSARYDAEGTAGILNIILRKGKMGGFNGSISSTVGYPEQYGLSGNLNYRTKTINVFTNLGYRYQNSPGNATFNTRFLDPNQRITSYSFQQRAYERKRHNYNGTLGMEYFITPQNSVTGTFTYQKFNGNTFVNNLTRRADANQTTLSESARTTDENRSNDTYQYALNYTGTFDDKGQKLTADLQYSNRKEEEIADISENKNLVTDNTKFTASKDFLLQIDYVLPFKKQHQLELGHKATHENIQSNFTITSVNGTATNEVLDFQQTVYAYYAQYGNKINAFSYLLGLRAETTKLDVDLIGGSDLNLKRDYTEWFPTVNFGYELNDNDNLTLGYSRRLRRPRYWFLSPFRTQSSSTFVFQGNPGLNPTFTHSFDVGYNTKIKKINLGTSVYYQKSKQPITVTSRIVDAGQVELRQPINLDSESRYGFELTTNYSPVRWARFSGSFNYFNYTTNPFLFTYQDNNTTRTVSFPEVTDTSWFARFSSRITLPAKIEWQTRVMYRGQQKSAQSNRKGMAVVNLAFSKDLFNDKASLVLNVSDLLNSRKRESTTFNPDRVSPESISNTSFQWRERQISLNFTYRFNQSKNRKRTTNTEYQSEGEGF